MSRTTYQCLTSVSGNSTYDVNPFSKDYDRSYFGSEADIESEVFGSLTRWIAKMEESERFDLGHQLEDMILDCTYSKYPCNKTL